MFSCIAAFTGPKMFGCAYDKRYARDKPQLEGPLVIGSVLSGISGVCIDLAIGIALITIAGLVLTNVLPLPQALGVAFLIAGPTYLILGIGGGVSACVLCGTSVAFMTTETGERWFFSV